MRMSGFKMYESSNIIKIIMIMMMLLLLMMMYDEDVA